MNQPTNHTDDIDRDLAVRCSEAGVLWVTASDSTVLWPELPRENLDWRGQVLEAIPGLRPAIEGDLHQWIDADEAGAFEWCPGVWIATSVVRDRRGTHAGAAIVPTMELLAHASFDAWCHGAGIDETWVKDRPSIDTPLVPEVGVQAMAGVVRQLHRGACATHREHEASDSVDRRLSESYEEIHLLHSLISGLVVGTEPDPFLRNAAEQLCQVAGFDWIAILVDETTESFAPDHVVVGTGSPTRAELRRLARTAPGTSDRCAVTCDGGAAGEIIVCPIRIEKRNLGSMVAGGRTSGAASNIELKLVSAAAGHIGIFLANASLYADLDSLFIGTLQSLVAAIDAKDPYTRGHSQRVALLSRDLAAALGMPEEFVKQIHLAGLVHDVGKIGVPEAVLRKPGRLSREEMGRIRQHPQIGYRILKDIPQLRDLLPAVLCHHEAWDGSGYPAGLAGEEIPLIARIVSVADSFDAMSSSRTYRAALSRERVFEELERCSGTQFDPGLVPTFLGLDLRAYDRHLMRDSVSDNDDGSLDLGLEAA